MKQKRQTKEKRAPSEGHRQLTIDDFFYVNHEDYDGLIETSIPYYKLLHEKLKECLPFDQTEQFRILDLGVGTGKTLGYLLHSYPYTHGTGVDLFSTMLNRAKSNLASYADRVEFIEGDMRDVFFKESSFDLVVSVLAIHHLRDAEKKNVFRSIRQWLKPGGIFMLGDWTTFKDPHLKKVADDAASKYVFQMVEQGKIPQSTAEEWIAHWHNVNLPATVGDQLMWLQKLNFAYASCIFRYYGIALIMARS